MRPDHLAPDDPDLAGREPGEMAGRLDLLLRGVLELGRINDSDALLRTAAGQLQANVGCEQVEVALLDGEGVVTSRVLTGPGLASTGAASTGSWDAPGEQRWIADVLNGKGGAVSLPAGGGGSALLLRLESNGRLWGALRLLSPSGRPFDTGQIEIAEHVGRHVALGLDRCGCFEQLQRAKEAVTRAHAILVQRVEDQKEAMLDNEARLQLALHAAALGLWEFDPGNGILIASPQVRDMLGVPFSEAPEAQWFSLLHPEDRDRVYAEFREAVESGKSFDVEFRLPRNGEVRWIRSSAHLIDGGGESRRRLVGLAEDITDRKRVDLRNRLLLQMDDETRPLWDPAEIIQMAARLLGEHLEVNRCAYADVEPDENTFNLSGDFNNGVETIVGRYKFDNFGDECLRLMRGGLPYVVEDSETDPRTHSVLEAYRRTKIRSAICVPLRKAGKFVAAMAVHQTTSRHWREDEIDLVQRVAGRCWESIERVRVERELRESEQRLRLAQRAGRTGSFEWRMDEGIILWTPELEELYGIAEGTFEGTFQAWRDRVVPEDADAVASGVEACIAKRQAEYDYEFRAVLPDGTHRWLRGQATFFYSDSGLPLRMVGVNIDVDDRRRAEMELQASNEALRRSNSELEEFAYVASHDLQEPLRMVNVYSELLVRRHAGGDPEALQYVQYISSGVKRMETLIQDLLSYSQAVHLEGEDSPAADLNAALRRAAGVLNEKISVTGATLVVEPLPMVKADEGQMSHVFQNLLSNALKYRSTREPVRIDICSWREDGLAVIAVRDNGIGFDSRYNERIFGLFKRLHKDAYPGNGLGLAICKRIVEKYRGRIWADSEPGKGATFYMALAAVENQAATESESRPAAVDGPRDATDLRQV